MVFGSVSRPSPKGCRSAEVGWLVAAALAVVALVAIFAWVASLGRSI